MSDRAATKTDTDTKILLWFIMFWLFVLMVGNGSQNRTLREIRDRLPEPATVEAKQ